MSAPSSLLYREALLEFERKNFARVKQMCEQFIQDDSADPSEFGNGLLLLANCHAEMGELDSAEALYKTCFAYLEEHLGAGFVGLATVLLNHAIVMMRRFPTSVQEQIDAPIALLHSAHKRLENVFGINRLLLADVFDNLGVCYEQCGKYTDALAAYVRSLRIRDKFKDDKGAIELQTAATLEKIAMIDRLAGRFAEALASLEVVGACRRKHLGPKDPSYLDALFHTALVAKAMEKRRQSEALFLRVFQTRLEVLGVEHPDTRLALQFLDCNNAAVLRALDGALAGAAERAANDDTPSRSTTREREASVITASDRGYSSQQAPRPQPSLPDSLPPRPSSGSRPPTSSTVPPAAGGRRPASGAAASSSTNTSVDVLVVRDDDDLVGDFNESSGAVEYVHHRRRMR